MILNAKQFRYAFICLVLCLELFIKVPASEAAVVQEDFDDEEKTRAEKSKEAVLDKLEKSRVPLPALSNRILGQTFRPAVLDWRNSSYLIHPSFGQLLELNNFETTRLGLAMRIPNDGMQLKFGLSYAHVAATHSSELLAKTPYRQAGRPSRIEADFGIESPVAEGILSQLLTFIPEAQVVFSLQATLRYLYYMGSTKGMSTRSTLGAWFSPRLTEMELQNLRRKAPAGMYLDQARINGGAGFAADVYFASRMYVNQSLTLMTPMLAPDSGLAYMWDLSLGVGYALP
jgi:hypothetical protein